MEVGASRYRCRLIFLGRTQASLPERVLSLSRRTSGTSQDVEDRKQKFSLYFVLTFFYICYKFSKFFQQIQTYSLNNLS
ncbi:hypothetical protein ABFA07_019884 [Porites harrisoni]